MHFHFVRAQLIFLNYCISASVRTGLEGPGLSFSQKIWYCLTTVGGRYIWSRLQSFSAFRRWGDFEQVIMSRQNWSISSNLLQASVSPEVWSDPSSLMLQRSLGRRLWLLIQRVEGLYKAASFSNLLIFLYTGRYLFLPVLPFSVLFSRNILD